MRCALVLSMTLVCLAGVARPASAHRPSESHLTFKTTYTGGEARLDVAVRDLDWAITLDVDENGAVRWSEITDKRTQIERFLLSGIQVQAGAAVCPLTPGTLQLVNHSDGAYVTLPIAFSCGADVHSLTLSYSLFFDQDPQHRALVRVADGSDKTLVLSKQQPRTSFAFGNGVRPGALSTIATFIRHGASHIAEGFDHLLFLLLLLLPAVLRRQDGRWEPTLAFKPALLEVTKVVTAFTAAHAITMTVAALGVVTVPSSLVEPAIALSLVIAAANNLWPLFAGGRWALPFALGLLHGFGFSSALADLGLPRGGLVPALFGFNLGVELGQLALVAVVVPLAFLLRRTKVYRPFAVTAGSVAIAAVALFWFIERTNMF